MLVHFVVNPHCPNIDYEKLATDIFGNQRCLIMLEKKPGWHVHVQGELLDGYDIDSYLTKLAAAHSKRKIDPNCRPVKKRKRPVDEVGYAYLTKHDDSELLYSNGFDDEELIELKRFSDQRREEVKQSMAKHIDEQISSGIHFDSQESLHHAFRSVGLDFYLSEGKLPPPNFQKLVLWSMIRSKHSCGATKDYVATRI